MRKSSWKRYFPWTIAECTDEHLEWPLAPEGAPVFFQPGQSQLLLSVVKARDDSTALKGQWTETSKQAWHRGRVWFQFLPFLAFIDVWSSLQSHSVNTYLDETSFGSCLLSVQCQSVAQSKCFTLAGAKTTWNQWWRVTPFFLTDQWLRYSLHCWAGLLRACCDAWLPAEDTLQHRWCQIATSVALIESVARPKGRCREVWTTKSTLDTGFKGGKYSDLPPKPGPSLASRGMILHSKLSTFNLNKRRNHPQKCLHIIKSQQPFISSMV